MAGRNDLSHLIESIKRLRQDLLAQQERAAKELDQTANRLKTLDELLSNLTEQRIHMNELAEKSKVKAGSGN